MMNKALIYLAGPISGLNYENATYWRDDVEATLRCEGFRIASPMRSKGFLNDGTILDKVKYDHVLASPQGVMVRDSWDVHRCDGVFANLLGAETVSIGTVMELAWAWRANIPAVVVMEPGNIHDHIMLQQSTPFYCETIDEGVELLFSLFV